MSIEIHHFAAADGTRLAWHEQGEGPPVLLLHGLFSDARTNWIRFGHAAEIAGRGLRVVMPDLRAHGESGKPHDPAFYPPDILADDGLALIAHLGLEDYDLGGYSLGARTAVRMVAKGARPKRLIVSGMGLAGLHHRPSRRAFQGDPDRARNATRAARPNGWPRPSSRPRAATPRRCSLCSIRSSTRARKCCAA
jgi:Predicted hydrolases or acyltransferases (alpha/beta hydrolase superfamily)